MDNNTAMTVTYDVMGTHVELDSNFVKSYLVHGDGDKITNQEAVFFMNTCKAQRLNPMVNGEVYLIKYGNAPAQMVVGKGAYLRRAFENPDYICKEDGIVVLRGNDVVVKEGCCLYPNESLLGGWCRVHFLRNGMERSAYKEVDIREYSSGKSNWRDKPALMINKVAISQCVRDAFPKDYEGLYAEEEMVASGAVPTNFKELNNNFVEPAPTEVVAYTAPQIVSREQCKLLFQCVRDTFGEDNREDADAYLKDELTKYGFNSTKSLPVDVWEKILDDINQLSKTEAEDIFDVVDNFNN